MYHHIIIFNISLWNKHKEQTFTSHAKENVTMRPVTNSYTLKSIVTVNVLTIEKKLMALKIPNFFNYQKMQIQFRKICL